MTSEQRLERLERIAKLFVRAAVRYRRDLRALGDKLNIMVNMQMQNWRGVCPKRSYIPTQIR